MKDEIIEFKTAVLAKEKGFNVDVLNFYTKPKSKMFGFVRTITSGGKPEFDITISRPKPITDNVL